MEIMSGEKEIKKLETKKPGIVEENGVLWVSGDEYVLRVAAALSSPTRIQILKYIREHEADVGDVAELIKQSKANASAQIKRLEEAGLVKTVYKPGQRGVKKICYTNIREVRIVL
uniref:ArsR family transcriptional regulator n=1 Tax=Fervidicoccus fontis TaxID=683846 RepID=A0A7J3ZJA6_9CREN